MSFSFREVFLHGWPVLSVLLIMSILSITVILERLTVLIRARMNEKAFVARILQILDEQGGVAALEFCKRSLRPMACVVARVISRAGDRAAMTEAAQKAVQEQINDLETRLPTLATVASTAPFVGLFGTVVGIIRAFHDISVNVGGGPEIVAAGISEALVATALGLLVAIPATMGYNYFVHQIQRMSSRIDVAVFDVIEELSSKPEDGREKENRG